jgi:hypothetical protein
LSGRFLSYSENPAIVVVKVVVVAVEVRPVVEVVNPQAATG